MYVLETAISLDFISFSIAQPSSTAGSLGTCTDTFQVGGAINKVPTICGDNNGQHSKQRRSDRKITMM